MTNVSDTAKFLQAVFGTDTSTHGIFAHSLSPRGMMHTRDVMGLDVTRDCYWCIASFQDDGNATRTLARALEVRALVVDDVGTKVPLGAVELALGRPTAKIETSSGNFQWVYRLASPVEASAWPAVFACCEALIGRRLEGRDAVHLFRLPCGVNTKKGRGRFQVRLAELNSGIELSLASGMTSGTSGAPASRPVGPGPSDPTPRVKNIEKLLGLIPNNDVDYDAWIARAHQVKALALDEEEGARAFDAWSRKSGKYDADETARRWATVSPTRTAGLTLLVDAESADRAEFEKIMNAEAGAAFDDGEVAPETSAVARVKFARNKQKQILGSLANAKLALAGLGIVCRHDEFHHRIFIYRASGKIDKLTDNNVLLLRDEIIRVYGKDFGNVTIGDAIVTTALNNGFNPVCDMLKEAEASWDGVKRLDRLGPDYFHTEDTALARACFRKVMIAAVRRARAPGCKFDQILVTESPEGWDKSSAWAALAGEGNFSDADILGKDAKAVQEELADIWIHEIADLSGLSKADVEHVKSFASRVNDRARPAYGRYLLDQPRQSIEVGTTNAEAYLMSMTGNRRFWTFKLTARVELAWLIRDRLQLWGEAARAESFGETLVLDKKLWAAAGVAQEERRVIDPWEDELSTICSGHAIVKVQQNGDEVVTNVGIHDFLGGHRGQHINSGSGRKIAEIMKRLGWERTWLKDAVGNTMRGYKRKPSSVVSVLSVAKNPF